MNDLGRFYVRAAAAVLLWLAAAAPAEAAWLRAESDNFVVFGEVSEDRLRQQLIELEDYNALLRRIMGTTETPSPNKLRVYLVRGLDGLRQVRRVASSVGGFYAASPSGIAAFANTSADGSTHEVVFHEYAHHFMMQYHSAAYPPWYVEGFAEYMMTASFSDRAADFGQPSEMRARALSNRSGWLSLERVLFDPGSIESGQARSLYYAESWLLTHYLLNDPARLAQLRAYVAALNRGEEPRAAFRASFGKTPGELQRELENYAYHGLTFRRMDRASIAQAPRITITRLPPSADDLLLLQASMTVEGQPPETLLARVRQQAARHPGDDYAKRVLAEAEALYGDGAAAERLLTELIAAHPNDAELLYLRGMRDLVAGERDAATRTARYRQARPWFARAHRADANHFQSLYRYVQTFSTEPGFLSENNAEVMLLAHNLAPQVSEIRMNAAAMLLARREFDLAETLILPLASTAHEGGSSAAARELLAKARAHDNAGVGVRFGAPDGD